MRTIEKRRLIIYVLFGALMLTSVAYAIVQTTLNITGTISKKGSIWSIYFTNASSPTTVGSAVASNGSIQSTSFSFDVDLYEPNDSVTYTVDVKNGGTIDAVLKSISFEGKDTASNNNITCSVTYLDGTELKSGDLLNIGKSKTIKILVKYDDIDSISSSDLNLKFTVTLLYEQTTSGSSSSGGSSGITSDNVIVGIYGNSIQNGTPTPTSPVEIQSVGERTNNLVVFNNKEVVNATSITDSNGVIRLRGNDGAAAAMWSAGELRLKFKKIITTNKTVTVSFYMTRYTDGIWKDSDNKVFQLLLGDSSSYSLLIKPFENYDNYPINERFLVKYTFKPNFDIENVSIRLNGMEWGVEYGTIQIEEGSTVTSYEPYGYKIPITVSNGTDTKTTNIYLKEPLRKIGDYADYLDLTNKKVVRNVKEYKITGGEQWTLIWTGDTTTVYKAQSLFTDAKSNSDKTIIGAKSNKLGAISYDGYGAGVTSIWNIRNNDNYKYQVAIDYYNNPCGSVFIKNIDYKSDISNFKKWLSDQYNNGNPVLVDYILTIPTEESVDIPSIPTLTGNITYSIGTTVQPSSINYGY